MEHSQESAFCVPTYSNSESACDGQTIDHTGRKQQRDSDEQVPVFQPRWRDQAQVKLEQLQPGGAAYAAASGHSTESSVHGSDEQAASNQRYMQVFRGFSGDLSELSMGLNRMDSSLLQSPSDGVVPDLSPTGSSSSGGLQTASDSMYNHSFNMFDTMDMQSGMSTIPACINPYFASYDQDLLSPAFSKRGLCGQDQRAPSHFIPTSSHAAGMQMQIVPTSQVQQAAAPQRPASAASYTVPKDVLRVGDEKPMDREARVARYREKRKRRTFEKTIRYESRKAYAEVRPRIKGRFATKEEVVAMKAEAAAMEKSQGLQKAVRSAVVLKDLPLNKRSRRSKRANAGTKPVQEDFVVPVYHN
ncbi:MAG: hypothetical protein FRX49_11543 [Trebouxia sp. A1-2]|nr:MAG: hypothetical protein FRX49_11543 [Trebouxia sp. A1-2]